jgi:hypothetical protein
VKPGTIYADGTVDCQEYADGPTGRNRAHCFKFNIRPDSCHRGTSLRVEVEGVDDGFRCWGEGVFGEVLVTGDANADLLQRS